jgi:hypothetical protein
MSGSDRSDFEEISGGGESEDTLKVDLTQITIPNTADYIEITREEYTRAPNNDALDNLNYG